MVGVEINESENLYNSAILYRDGNGIPISRSKSLDFFLKSAELGHIGSICWVILISKGVLNGTIKDINIYNKWINILKDKDAVTFYTNRICDDNADAEYSLGILYEEGILGNYDYTKALHWYKIASEKEYPPAQNNYGYLLRLGRGTNIDNEKAEYFYLRSAENGFVIAQNNLALLYKEGKYFTKDISKSLYWLQKACDLEFSAALHQMGDLYFKGECVDKNMEKAKEYYIKSSTSYPIAINSIGNWYQSNKDENEENIKIAYDYYNKASKLHIGMADFNIYQLYKQNLIEIPNNLNRNSLALFYLGKSVQTVFHVSYKGMKEYALKLIHGSGYLENKQLGIEWLIKASVCGVPGSVEHLLEEPMGIIGLITLGILELDINTSLYSFSQTTVDTIDKYIKDNIYNIERELYFTEDFNAKLLILKALIRHKTIEDSIILLKPYYKQLLQIITNEIPNIDKFSCPPPLLKNSIDIAPFHEISIPKIAFECLKKIILHFEDKQSDIRLIPQKDKYEETLTITIEDSKNNDNIIAFTFDDCLDKYIFAHKDILLKQYYFKILFECGMKESVQDIIHLKEVSNVTFMLYKQFLYGIDIYNQIDGDSLMECIATSHYLSWSNFHTYLCNFISLILDWDQVSSVYNDGLSISNQQLMDTCKKFGFNHFGELINTRGRFEKVFNVDKDFIELIMKYIEDKLKMFENVSSVFEEAANEYKIKSDK